MNPVLARIPGSLIRELNARKGPDSIDLGLGEPQLRPDPDPLTQAAAFLADQGCPYSPNAGFADLREAIARHYAYPGLASAANVVVTHGSQEALYLGIKATLDPAKDRLLVVEPAYPAYAKIAQMEGIAVDTLPIPAPFRPTADAILAAVTPGTRMVLLGSPANPTGAVLAAHEARKLAAGLATLPDPPWVLADEVYRELTYGEAPYVSIAEHHPRTLVANSLSKSNALTGLRLGFLMGPAEAVAAATKVHQFVTTAASTFSQRVAQRVYAEPARLATQRPHYARQREVVLAALAGAGLPHVPPDGAFYVLVQLPERLAGDSVAAAYALLERHQVVAIPGAAFGPSAEGWLRLSFVAPEAQLREGVARIAEFCSRG